MIMFNGIPSHWLLVLQGITFADSDARTGDTGDAPRSRDASADMTKQSLEASESESI
jgi:hypothetical protein